MKAWETTTTEDDSFSALTGEDHSLMPALSSMVSRLTLEHPERQKPHTYKGAILFADVSGFTSLTEALTQEGPEGSELLSRLLGDYFTPLLSQIEAHGGFLTGFAGDALSVLFHGENSGGDTFELRALRCAMALQEETARFSSRSTPIGQVHLSIKIGLAKGTLSTAVVGSPVLGQSLIAYGDGLTRATQAERAASPGHICFSNTQALDIPGLDTIEVSPGILRLKSWHWEPVILPFSPTPTATPADLRAYIPPAIWPYITHGAGAFLNSIRTVTAMFIGFGDLTNLGEGRHGALADYIIKVQEIVDGYRGFFASFDGSDKGNTLIALFGAPLAIESPGDRAMACALDIQSLGEGIEAIQEQRIGIATGSLYVGLVGGGSQRRYTALGDPMNLAARLMGKCEGGDILLDGNTATSSSGGYEWSPARKISVKGKHTEVEVRSLQSRAKNTPKPNPKRGRGLVGRSQELRHLRECTESALMGQGNVVLITGEAGLGKSRLLAPLISHATDTLKAKVIQTRTADYVHNSAYEPFIPVIKYLLTLPQGRVESSQIERAASELGVTLGQESCECLRAILNNENAQSSSRPCQGDRLVLLEDLILDLMKRKHPKAPLFLIFEEAQWMGGPSAVLLQRLAYQIKEGPFLLVITSRYGEDDAPLPWQQTILDKSRCQHLALSPLGKEDIRKHACARMRASSVGPDVLKVLVTRSRGNPLVLEEICDLLRQMGQVVVSKGVARLTLKPHELTVPKGLGELVLARLESLDTPTRIVLQVASVLGQRFSLDVLEAVHPGPIEAAELREAIDAAHDLDIIRVIRDSKRQTYFFKHVLARDAIYSSLTFELRRKLHGLIASYLEGMLNEDTRAHLVPVIAEHYRRLDDKPKLRHYAIEAGDLAIGRSMNRVAAMWYMIAADIHRDLKEGSAEGEALNHAFEAMRVLGDLEEQGQLLMRWEDLGWALDDDTMLSKVYLAKTSFLHRRGESDAALEAGEDAADILEELGETIALTRLAVKICTIHLERRDLLQAEAALKEGQRWFAQAPNPEVGALLTAESGVLFAYKGDLKQASSTLKLALDKARAARLSDTEAHVLGNLGIVELRLRDYPTALKHLEGAAEICHTLGSLRHEGRHRFNMAYLLMHLGSLAEALQQLLRARQLFERTDWQQGLQAVLINLLRLSWLMGENEEARHIATRLQVVLPGAPPPILCEYYWNLGELSLREGAWQLAVGEFGNCLELAEEKNLPFWRQQALEGRSEARLRQGELGKAEADSQEAMDLFESVEEQVEWPCRSWHRRAMILGALGDLSSAEEAMGRAAAIIKEITDSVPEGPLRLMSTQGLSWRARVLEEIENNA